MPDELRGGQLCRRAATLQHAVQLAAQRQPPPLRAGGLIRYSHRLVTSISPICSRTNALKPRAAAERTPCGLARRCWRPCCCSVAQVSSTSAMQAVSAQAATCRANTTRHILPSPPAGAQAIAGGTGASIWLFCQRAMRAAAAPRCWRHRP